MPAIVTRRPVTRSATTQGGTRKMLIRSEDGSIELRVPFAPRTIEYSALGRNYTEIERPGRRPILSASKLLLPRLGFELFLGSGDPDKRVEAEIRSLRKLARAEDRVVVSFGPSEAGLWHLTNLSISSQQRHSENQAITRATAQVEFTRVSDADVKTSPIKGGHKGGGGKGGGRTVKVRKGESLHEMAVRIYDDPRMWRVIADKNGIRNPTKGKQLKPGRKLTMPKRKGARR